MISMTAFVDEMTKIAVTNAVRRLRALKSTGKVFGRRDAPKGKALLDISRMGKPPKAPWVRGIGGPGVMSAAAKAGRDPAFRYPIGKLRRMGKGV